MVKSFSCLILCLTLGAPGIAGAAPAGDNPTEGQAPPEVVAVGRMTHPPALDGDLSDWPEDATVLLLGQASDTLRRHYNWTGTADSSAAIRLAWDRDYLYLAADVSDDHLDQATTPAETWQGDTLELFFNIHPCQQRTDGFWQLGVVPPLAPGARLRVECPQQDFRGVEGTARVRSGGYTLECRIPWKNLTGFVPAEGTYLGFQVYIDDRDGAGRKSQLAWYPSAITYAHPPHTNELILREHGQTTLPRVLAGPNAWCVTDPRTMAVSVIADVPGASTATFAALPPFPELGAPVPAPITIPLHQVGDRISTGQGVMAIAGCSGLYNFGVQVADTQGRVVATNLSQAQLQGDRFAEMHALYTAERARSDALQKRDDLDPAARAGLPEWLTRNSAFLNNEARPESVNATLIEQILGELHDLDRALTVLEAGGDPYAAQRGSFVRAYRSPLTGQFRPYALFLPRDYDTAGPARPLIVLLHSIFADERQLAGLSGSLANLGAIVYQAAAYRQYDWSGISAAETWAGLEDVEQHYRIDPDRVYLIGLHQGGRGVWELAGGRPDLWAAAAPLFSGIDSRPAYPALRLYPQYYRQATDVKIPPPIFKAPPPPAPLTDPLERSLYERASLVPLADNLARLPLRSAYGEDDPDAAAERLAMQQRLSDLGAPLPTHYVPGAMHGSMAAELTDPGFYYWLLSQRRPAYPHQISFTVQNLRYNSAWWVRADQLASPAQAGRIEATLTGAQIAVKTTNLTALSLLLDSRLAPVGSVLAVQVDGQVLPAVTVGAAATAVSYLRGAGGAWQVGSVPAGEKKHGLSGPLDDFQFGRLLFVYGTGGDASEQALLAKVGKSMADWGLGAVFPVKADREVTDQDLREAALILIGTPATNSVLARMAGDLPLRWSAAGMRLGAAQVAGPGAGACFIYPNPLAPEHYMVVVTAADEAGYQVWKMRGPGGDYVLGRVTAAPGGPTFLPTARGWFDNRWHEDRALCLETLP